MKGSRHRRFAGRRRRRRGGGGGGEAAATRLLEEFLKGDLRTLNLGTHLCHVTCAGGGKF